MISQNEREWEKLINYAKTVMKVQHADHTTLSDFWRRNPDQREFATFMIAQKAIDIALENIHAPVEGNQVQQAAEEALEKYHDTFRELGKD